MKALIIAFSMYSKIPMPKVSWTQKSMKNALCFFPLIGMVIGGFVLLEYYLFQYFQLGVIFRTAIFIITPLVITGGIHLDGFIDTMDARRSYQEKEKKLAILQDPHIGAFALICSLIYFFISLAFMSEITSNSIWLVAIGFVLSRALSGLGVVTLKGAKANGLVATFADMARKPLVQAMMILYIILSIVGMLLISPVGGIATSMIGILTFLYYRYISYKEFGGITGDLAGYFIQICELAILIMAVILER